MGRAEKVLKGRRKRQDVKEWNYKRVRKDIEKGGRGGRLGRGKGRKEVLELERGLLGKGEKGDYGGEGRITIFAFFVIKKRI